MGLGLESYLLATDWPWVDLPPLSPAWRLRLIFAGSRLGGGKGGGQVETKILITSRCASRLLTAH